MICNVCGCPNPDGVDHCQSCGRPFARPVSPPPVSAYFQKEPPAVQALRRTGGSNLLLVLAILYTVNILVTACIGIFNSAYSINGYTYSATSSAYLAVFSGLIGAIVPALFAAGFWAVFASCKNRGRPVRTTGITILKVMVVIEQISAWFLAFCLLVVLSVLFVLALAGELDQLERSINYSNLLSIRPPLLGAAPWLRAQDGAIALLFRLMFLVLTLTVKIILTFKLLRIIRAVRYTLQTGKPSDDIPGGAIVLSYIMAGLSLLSVLAGGWTILSSLVGAATYTLLGLLLARYRSEMRWLMGSGDPAVFQGYFTYVCPPALQAPLGSPAPVPVQSVQPGLMLPSAGITGYCRRCGGALRPDDRICSYCGWPR
ncbi:MAG: hypothetical protein HFE86_04735 [Clostridiales bacterium]|nr:hypothetical protein [Clostridiales bacterium]